MATLKDVAALAGVSTATVSLALNGGPVNEKTRETVKKAARQLNYFPNKIGRMLKSGRSNTIELVILTSGAVPNIVRGTSLFHYLMEGILAVADEHKLAMRFAVKSYEDDDVNAYFSELVGGRTVEGVIIVPQFAQAQGFTQLLEQAGFPFVMLRPAAFGTDVSFVDMGNYEGARMVAELLVGCGARRLGIINGPAIHVDAIERERGFTETLLDGGAARLVVHDHSALAMDYAEHRARKAFPALTVERASYRFLQEGAIDVLVVSHVLNELDEAGRAELAGLVSRAQIVVWVEPGTHEVSRALAGWRERLRGEGWLVAAPCTHAAACGLFAPENERHWCHFFASPPPEIFANSEWVRFGQRAGIDLRSLPYSFLVLDRRASAPPAGVSRILGEPRIYKGYAKIFNCDADGVSELNLQQRADKALFKALKRPRGPLLYRWTRDGDKITAAERAG